MNGEFSTVMFNKRPCFMYSKKEKEKKYKVGDFHITEHEKSDTSWIDIEKFAIVKFVEIGSEN